MLSLHQLRCFLATYEHGSLTGAAESLGYAQPSVSEQVRALERTIGLPLFRRVGRGVVPTTVAESLRPHAERTLAAAEDALLAARSISALETGTIRFGLFGNARLYMGATVVSEVLDRHPGVRVELIGANSVEVLDDLRRGRIEAALIALPTIRSEGMEVTPVGRDELVYVSADPARTAAPVTAEQVAGAHLVMPDTTWRESDSARVILRQWLHGAGYNPSIRVEVEETDTALELTGLGYGDTIMQRGSVEQLAPRLAPDVTWVSLDPQQWDVFAVVHRADAQLSPAARLLIDIATRQLRTVMEPWGEV